MFVVVDPDPCPRRQFELRDTLDADFGLLQNAITIGLWNHLLQEAAAGFLGHVLIWRREITTTNNCEKNVIRLQFFCI